MLKARIRLETHEGTLEELMHLVALFSESPAQCKPASRNTEEKVAPPYQHQS